MSPPIKAIIIGESGTGKTGALASLLGLGLKVNIIDLDNGMDALVNLVSSPNSKYPKDSLSRLSYETITEPMRVSAGRIIPAKASVWQRSVNMLENWSATNGGTLPAPAKLGSVNTWGPDSVLVIDTLSTLGTAAKNFHLMMQGKLGADRTSNEARRDIGAAQTLLDTLLQLVFDTSIKCHVIINTHITYAKEDGTSPQDGEQCVLFGFPAAIGKALSPRAPKYFNNMLLVKKTGTTSRIYTRNQPLVGLKSSAPLKVADSYPLETGLADYFKAIRE
jgi:hypothetical protein